MPEPKINPAERKNPKAGRAPKKITETYLHNAGLYYLQRFAASSAHFRRVMLRKVRRSCLSHKDQSYEDCAGMVEALIRTFESAGLLDDSAYARGAVTSLRRRGLSKKAILGKMKLKGISAEDTLRHLEEYDRDHGGDDGGNGELRAALTFARKKRLGPFKGAKDLPDEKSLAALGRAGFSYDTARSVLNIPPDEAEEKIGS